MILVNLVMVFYRTVQTVYIYSVTDRMLMKDLCYRGQGFIGQHGKETKTSWDTLSYTLIQSHNVFQHISAVQEANRRYEQGVILR